MSQGSLFIISAPSGAGKTSLVKSLTRQDNEVLISISHTTRAMRPGEEDGQDYHFVDHETFSEMVSRNEFIEYAKVFDNSYGTSKESVEHQLSSGKDVILEIDWQGARQIRGCMHGCQSIFILPPSIDTLKQRLESRGQDDSATIARRMHDALTEISHYDEFDYLIINDNFDKALSELQAIFSTSRLRREAQIQRHPALFESLAGHDST